MSSSFTEHLSPAPNLSERALRVIRAAIITGEIRSGEIHSAPSLADKLGVSATPVREALLHLAHEGLVEPVRNRGFCIAQLTEHDLNEVFELRLLLEPRSVRKAAGHLRKDEIEVLRGLIEQVEVAIDERDFATYFSADHDFHGGLLRPLENRRLSQLVGRLRYQQLLYALPQVLDSERFRATVREHGDILDAMAVGDGATAETVMERHLSHARGIWAGIDELSRPTSR